MCLIIINKSGKLDKSILIQAAKNNPEGFGLMYAKNGKLLVYRTFIPDNLTRKYFMIRSNFAGIIVMHFRIATSGKLDNSNLHPFLIDDNLAMMHNGIFSNLGNKIESDTAELSEILRNINGFNPFDKKWKKILSLICGYSSKLVFLSNKGQIQIINEQYGHWVGSNWYSNYSYINYTLPGKKVGFRQWKLYNYDNFDY